MVNATDMTVELISSEDSEKVVVLLAYGETEIATASLHMQDADALVTVLDMLVPNSDAPYILNSLHANTLILSTIMQAWGDHETVEDIFNGGSASLVVDRALYRGEKCNDSETKRVECNRCFAHFDSELPVWLAGDEQCPECDHIMHVERSESH